jgi:hypothetical protein
MTDKKTLTYVERNKGKLKEYHILRGKHTRSERLPGGDTAIVTYSPANNKILLTEAGAKSLATALELREVGGDGPVEVKGTKEIKIPENWEDLPAGNIIALAKLITGKNVRSADKAIDIIDSYLAEQADKAKQAEKDDEGDDDKKED